MLLYLLVLFLQTLVSSVDGGCVVVHLADGQRNFLELFGEGVDLVRFGLDY